MLFFSTGLFSEKNKKKVISLSSHSCRQLMSLCARDEATIEFPRTGKPDARDVASWCYDRRLLYGSDVCLTRLRFLDGLEPGFTMVTGVLIPSLFKMVRMVLFGRESRLRTTR